MIPCIYCVILGAEMEHAEVKLKRYLKEALGVDVQLNPWHDEENLPFYLRNLYAFFELKVLSLPCLAMMVKEETEQTPATIEKHMSQVQLRWHHGVIYVRSRMTAYHRKRLIEHKIPFIVPGNQMYLPFLATDLREHFRSSRSAGSPLSPATQTIILYALLHTGEFRVTPKHLAESLGYSAMTMTRALDELEAAQLGKITREGRERVLRFEQGRETLWKSALELLRSPVKKRLWIRRAEKDSPFMKAGLSALAAYSRLAPPSNPVFALAGKQWKKLEAKRSMVVLPVAEPDACELEIWSYPPELFAENGLVDRFSLYLSMQENEDERVTSALEEMMEQVSW